MTFDLKTLYANYTDCSFNVREDKKGVMDVSIYGCSVGENYKEPIMNLNIQVPNIPKDCIAIKDYSENEGLLESMISIGLVKKVVDYRPSGFVHIPICEIDKNVLNLYKG